MDGDVRLAAGKRTLTEGIQLKVAGDANPGTAPVNASPRSTSGPTTEMPYRAAMEQSFGRSFGNAHEDAVAFPDSSPSRNPVGPMRVMANGLHVRSSPDKGNDSNIVSTLQQHETVKATGQHGEWTQIEHEDKPAFAFAQYLAPIAPVVPTTQPATSGSTPVAPALASPVETAAPAGGTLNVAPDPAHVDKHATDKHHDKHAHHAHGEKKPKAEKATRYTKYGGGRVKTVLAKLVQERGLQHTISGREIAQLDGLSEVETGGNVAAVDTTDDEVVSIGFHQIVLGDLSIQEVMQKVPAAFAKHGLELDTSAKYDVKSKPFRIKGVEHPNTLRTREWGDKFYDASAEPDVILAIAEYALKEKKLVAKITEKVGGTGDWFQDITAETWLLEMHNSRPGWVGAVVKRAVDNHAKAAKTRDEFLNILASSMMDVYGEKEPIREFNSQKKSAAKSGHPLDATAADALKASLMAPWTKIGRTKAEHITTKIPRSMVPVHLDATASATAAPATPAPAKVAPVIADHHDDHHEEAPKPKPVPVAPVEKHHVEQHHEEKPVSPPPVAVQHTHHEEEKKAVVPPTPTVTPTAPAQAVAKQPEPIKNLDPAPAHVDGKVKPHILHLEDFPAIHAFVPPGGVQGHVEVLLFLHGMYAYYEGAKGAGINDPDPDRSMNLAGAAATTTRNLVTLAPVATSTQNSWPHWKELAQNGTFPKLIKKALEQLSTDMSIKPNLEVGSISLAGHSAGGQGIGFAAGQLMDAVHDVTMEDGGYGNGKSKDWAPAHRELGKWLLGGNTDKILRVMYRKDHDHSEGDIIQSVMNPEKLEALAHSKDKDFNFPGVTVTRDEGNRDKRTVKDAYLDHVLHIHGRPGTRTVNVFVVNTGDHMRLRNDVTHRLMTEGRDTEFEQGVTAPTGPLSATGPMPAQQDHPKHAKHAKHANKEHHEEKPATTTPVITPTPANAPPDKIDPVTAATAPAKADPKHHHKEAHHKEAHEAKPEVLSGPIKATRAKHGYDRDEDNLDSYGNPTERQRGRQINSAKDDHRVFTNPFNVVKQAHLFTHDLKETKRTLDKGIVLHTYAVKEHNKKSYAQIETVGVSKDDDLWISFADLGGHGETNPHFGNDNKDDNARGDAIKDRLPKTGRKPGESKHHWGFAGKFLASSEGVALDGALMAKINKLMEWAIAEDMVTGNITLTSGVRPPQTAHKLCIRYQLAHQNGAHINFDAIRNLKDGMYLGWKWLPEGPDHSNEAIMKHAAGWMYTTYGGGGAPAAAGYPETDKERRGPILMDGPKVSMHCPGHAVDVKIPWRNEKNPAEEDVWGWEEIYHQFGLTRPLHKDRGGSQTAEYWHVEETGKKLDGVEGE